MDTRLIMPLMRQRVSITRSVTFRWTLRLWLGLIGGLLACVLGAQGAPERRWTAHAYAARFEHITTTHGLSQNTVFCTLQDRKGFLWFGTENGLNRYDGNRFTIFRRDERHPGSLGGNWVSCLMEDRQGYLWVGTMGGGLNRLDPRTLRFVRYGPSDGIAALNIASLAEDKDGNLWIGTRDDGVFLLPHAQTLSPTPKFHSFRASPGNPWTLPGNIIQALHVDQQGTLWVGMENAGLCRFRKGQEAGTYQMESFPTNRTRPQVSAPPDVTSLAEDNHGVLWIGSTHGLYSYHQGQFRRFTHQAQDPHSLSINIVRRVYLDRAQTLWVGTDGGGLHRMLPRKRPDEAPSFIRFMNDPKDPHTLVSNAVESIYEDRSGVLWVGTFVTGLDRLMLRCGPDGDREKRILVRHSHNPAKPESLGGNTVNGVVEDRFGNLWVGTDGAGLNRAMLPKSKDHTLVWEHFRGQRGKPGALQEDVITCLYADSKRHLWAGTFQSGLVRVDQTDGSPSAAPRFTHFKNDPKNPASLRHNFVVSICEDRKHRMWIGMVNGGLDVFDPVKGTFQHIPCSGPGTALKDAYSIVEDAFGTLWIGTFEGLRRFNPETGELRVYMASTQPGALSHQNAFTLFVDRAGVLWIGTNGGGLNRTVGVIPPWNGPEPTFQHYTTQQGLPSDVVQGLLEDDRGQLWMSTSRALCRFDPAAGKAIAFPCQEDLQGSEFLTKAFFRNSCGEMVFGGTRGISIFHPEDVAFNTQAPQLALTDFQLLNQPVGVGETLRGRVPLERAITETQHLTLSHNDYVFSLEFAALHFASPDKNQYAYILEGLDQAWNHVGNRHFITYTTLPPGFYTLRIKGANCDGIWSQEELRLTIRVLPPWWRTWWFRLAAGVVLVGLIYWAVQARLRALNMRNFRLEEMVNARTRELAEANEALRNQSLTDPLTGLRNRRYLGACLPKDIAQVQRVQRDVRNNPERMKLNIDVLFVMVDLDFFKKVNDQHGHQAGDMVLQQLGPLLQNAVRNSDTVARWGGEEFLVVARNSARMDAEILPERIRAAVENHPFDIGEAEPLRCTCSIGFSVYPLIPGVADLFSWEQIVNIADLCLYAAKRNGRNAWVGVIPDLACLSGRPAESLPQDVNELIQSGLLPVVTSLKQPIQWQAPLVPEDSHR